MEEESGDPLPPSVGDPAGGSMEEENRDPSPLCHREKMPPCVSSPSAQFVWPPAITFVKCSCQCHFCDVFWAPYVKIPIEFDHEDNMMSFTEIKLWNWSDDGGQTVSVETTMAGIAMSNHAAAEPVDGAGEVFFDLFFRLSLIAISSHVTVVQNCVAFLRPLGIL